MEPVIPASARENGVPDEDMLHAYRNPTRVFDVGEVFMLVGATATGRLIEVGLVTSEGVEFIVHAMAARPKFLR